MTLIISYYNAGVECEHLEQYEEAEDHYKKGLELSQANLDKANDMPKQFKLSLKQIGKMLKVQREAEMIKKKEEKDALKAMQKQANKNKKVVKDDKNKSIFNIIRGTDSPNKAETQNSRTMLKTNARS